MFILFVDALIVWWWRADPALLGSLAYIIESFR